MARKNYQVIAKNGAAWQKIHNELTSNTYHATNIPDRPCLCKNETKHSETRGTYQLSVTEVEELRKNPDVAAVFVDPNYHPDTDKYDCTPCSLRFGKNVKNYRTLFSVANTEYTEVASSLMSITGQLNQGTTNWILVKNAHSGTAAMNYWQSVGFPLIYDYGVYPSAPTNASDPDPLRSTTQTGSNLVTISNTGYYELEVACDGEYGAVWTNNYPKVPLVTTDDLTKNTDDLPSTFPDNIWGKDRKDPRNQGIGYRIIQLGKLNAGTITINFEVRNGSMTSGAETWDRNPGCIAWKLRFLGDLNIRELGGLGNAGNSTFVTHIPQDNPTSADHNRTGYQILRCAEGTSTNPWSDTTSQVSQDISYTNDGTDVDCIVLDNGVWTGHPEFVTDDEDPQHYISGNVLSAHARSGVLDILLDAPMYLDPEYWITNPSLVTTRWDGTRVPTETSARNWWSSASNRSNSFTDFGSITVPGGYSRARHCGTDSLPPTNNVVQGTQLRNGGGHGTPCASLMYGKNYGWAFNSNKWTLSYPLGQADAPAADACLDAIKVFHQYKPTNPKHGTQDPTVTNCSFSTGGMFGRINFDKTNYGRFQFQPSGNSWNPANDVTYDQADYNDNNLPFNEWGSQPDFMRVRVMGPGSGGFPAWLNPGTTDASFPSFYAMREAANAGVVFVAAGGNDGMYRSTDTDPNFWNARTWTPTSNCDAENDNCGYTNRGSWPGSHNYRLSVTNPSDYATDNFQEIFVIGAMDDQLLGDMRKTTSSDALLKDTGTRNPYADSCEITANNLGNNCDVLSPFGASYGQHGDSASYSNVGPLIDFYAPADSTLAASTVDNGNALPYSRGTAPVPQHPSTRTHAGGGSYKYRDGYFNGTSAAAPVAAGLLACILQQNRGWLPNVLKTNVKLGISNATNWYKGFAPNGAFDLKWLSQYDTKGEDVKIIKEWSGEKTTPNPSYETTSGIAPSRPNLNERFSITGSGSHDVKIIAIKEFSTSDAGSPTELRIANGWYPVQIKKDTTSSSDLANYRMRVKSGSNEQVLEISSNGGSAWTALTITAVNGNFETDDSGRFWYYLNVADSVGLPAVNNPTYNIQTNAVGQALNEGTTLITTVTTTNVADGTTLYWSFSGTNITSSDFSSGSLTGSGSISNNSFNFTHVVADDLTTEGNETIEIKVFTDAARQLQVATKNITITDTSLSASYAIVPSTTSVNEGSPLNYGVGTSNVANGTTLYWSLSGSGITAGDFSPSGLTGSGTINNNAFTVTRTLVQDSTTEGNETITFKLFTDSGRTNEVASNSSVTIQDTSTTPVEPAYNLSVSPTSVNEGETFTSTVTTTNVAQGTTIYWSAMGANIDNNDYSSGSMTGSGTVGFDGTFQFSHTLAEDEVTEGAETILVKIFTNAGYTQQVGSTVNVTVNDTSQAKTYAISSSSSSLSEGDSFIVTVTTSNVAVATTLYWEISGTNITSADFTTSLTGSGNVNSQGFFSFSRILADDLTTEGTETFVIKLFTDAARTNEVAQSSDITINDTSIPAPTSTYNVSADFSQVSEGGTQITLTCTTTNVAAATTLYWNISGNNITSADIVGGVMQNQFNINSQGIASWGIGFTADATLEGNETATVKVFTDSARTIEVASTQFEILDSSIPAPTYQVLPNPTQGNEGTSFTTTISTTNVPDGTVLYWSLEDSDGTNTYITSDDFSSGALTGSGTISSSSMSFSHTLANDLTTESLESIWIRLYGDSARLSQLAYGNFEIADTSQSPTASYTISPDATTIAEGQMLNVRFITSNVAAGTDLYWIVVSVSGNVTAADVGGVGSLSQAVQTPVSGNTYDGFSYGFAIDEDATTEGPEVFKIELRTGSQGGTLVATSPNITISDTSLTPASPVYTITTNKSSYDEGEFLYVTMTTQNVTLPTTLYWEFSGTNITTNDFTEGTLEGQWSIDQTATNTFSTKLRNDLSTEGNETLTIKGFSDSARTNQVGNTVNVTINDTSVTSAVPAYNITPNVTQLNEGSTLITTVTTQNVPAGTTLYWKINEETGTISAADIVGGSLDGSEGVNSQGFFIFSKNLADDLTTEGEEKFTIKLYTDATFNLLVATSPLITINDTSLTPNPTYSITPNVTQLNEGATLTTTITTQDVADGTTLYWVVDEHTGTINSADFSTGSMSGTGTVSNNTFNITHVIANDVSTEGEEKFTIKLYTDAGYTNNVANTSVIEIFDTSQTANATYSLSTTASKFKEGDSFTTTVTTTQVTDSTTLWWRLEGIDANDLSSGTIEGSGIITSDTFSFSHTLANDLADEGDENIQIKLYSDSARNNQVGNTLAVLIKDTSQVGFNVIVTAPNNNEYILVGNDTDGTI